MLEMLTTAYLHARCGSSLIANNIFVLLHSFSYCDYCCYHPINSPFPVVMVLALVVLCCLCIFQSNLRQLGSKTLCC